MSEIPKVLFVCVPGRGQLPASGHAIGTRAGPAGGFAPSGHVEQKTTVHVVGHTGARRP